MTANKSHPDEKQQIVDNVVYRYSTAWIHELEPEKRWRHYWHQQKIMQGWIQPGEHILEIGVGSGFTANYLRSKGFKVTTIDIDEEKHPDIVANIVTHDFAAQAYDHILAFEVLEHIPFEQVETLLPRLHAVCRRMIFISVPMNRATFFHLDLKLPKLKPISWRLTRKIGAITTPHHFWEVDFQQITRQKLEATFAQAGFCLRRREEVWGTYLFYAFERCDAR